MSLLSQNLILSNPADVCDGSGPAGACFYVEKNFLHLSLQMPGVTGATCKATVPRSCLSAVVALVPQEHLLARKRFVSAVTGSQLSVLPASGSVTQQGCTTEQCSPPFYLASP